MSRPDILLVEDDPSDVAIALRAFRKHGLEGRVEVVRDGHAALEYLRWASESAASGRRPPKVVFLDLKMPKLDGLEVLREMRADEKLRDLIVVVVSSSGRESDVRESYRLGANSFLRKRLEPGSPGEYLATAARYWVELNQSPPS